MSPPAPPTAAILIIGNEILSGRTQDSNTTHIARELGRVGIRLREVRVVPDEAAEIVAAVNALRQRYTHVFTTGGIGPTHDDITADCVAMAFGVKLIQNPEARGRLERHYAGTDLLNAARLRMANTPEGATLIDNPVSAAPGFQIGNVFVMAGVPSIMQAMLAGIIGRLAGGPPVDSRTVISDIPEGTLAEGLGAIQAQWQGVVDIGSYPSFRQGRISTSLVLRSTDIPALDAAAAAVVRLVQAMGGSPDLLGPEG